MHRIDSATAREDVNGIGKKGFSDNADLPQHDATYLTPRWLNAVQEEIANVIEGTGAPLNPADNTQLLQAINSLVKGRADKIVRVASTPMSATSN